MIYLLQGNTFGANGPYIMSQELQRKCDYVEPLDITPDLARAIEKNRDVNINISNSITTTEEHRHDKVTTNAQELTGTCPGVSILYPAAFAPVDWNFASLLFSRNDELSITEVSGNQEILK